MNTAVTERPTCTRENCTAERHNHPDPRRGRPYPSTEIVTQLVEACGITEDQARIVAAVALIHEDPYLRWSTWLPYLAAFASFTAGLPAGTGAKVTTVLERTRRRGIIPAGPTGVPVYEIASTGQRGYLTILHGVDDTPAARAEWAAGVADGMSRHTVQGGAVRVRVWSDVGLGGDPEVEVTVPGVKPPATNG